MRFAERFHHGYPGLWATSVIIAAGTATMGALFIFDGTGVTASPTFQSARRLLTGLGIPARNVMNVWGVVFLIVGLSALWPFLTDHADLDHRSRWLFPAALLWMLWSVMFLIYAFAHDGFGLVGGLTWAMIAAAALASTVALADHARNG